MRDIKGLFCVAVLLIWAISGKTQGTQSGQCNFQAIGKQQAAVHRSVEAVLANVETFWGTAFPNGQRRAHDNRLEREKAWSPKLNPSQKQALQLNDGVGCISFISKDPSAPSIPELCAPFDIQAQLGMEALREAWENTKIAPENTALSAIHESLPEVWAEEKTIFCVLRPETQYIDLNDVMRPCTPESQ